MSELRSYERDDIAAAAPMTVAIDALRACFAAGPGHVARSQIPAAGGEFLLMPAVDGGAAGIKLLMIQPGNAARGEPVIQGTYVLFDAAAGSPVALFDGAALTNVRTPAVSAIATDILARDDVRTLGVLGSGPQAAGHVEAMLCVRPQIERVVVASRTRANAEAAATASGPLAVVGSRPVARRQLRRGGRCDVVCAATRPSEPVATAAMVMPGAHVNAVGSYRTDMRELPRTSSPRHRCTSTIATPRSTKPATWPWRSPMAVGTGACSAAICTSSAPVATRDRTASEITLFKSVGLAVEDLVIARLVAGRGWAALSGAGYG